MKKVSVIARERSALENLQPVLVALQKFGYEVELLSDEGSNALKEVSLLIVDVCSGIGGEFQNFLKKYPVVPAILCGCGDCGEKEFVWHEDQRAILAKAMLLLGEEEISKLLSD